ncbi:hypothetical protein RI543_001837 [Arxiozyma heterogenica]|uniref:Biogenesis of lysosome-related organelles complex 1 subunit KXD1 n=1 Tax=Arxiozyma heterogenica TaxID=278026 RepID=A0AAN7WMS7_9SACH|nr:hypothetical protein RI543_001837 [Kazachstania heterogenica]
MNTESTSNELWSNVEDSQVPSISSQNYAIPFTEDIYYQISTSSSSNSNDYLSSEVDVTDNDITNSNLIENNLLNEEENLVNHILDRTNEPLQNHINNENILLRHSSNIKPTSNTFTLINEQGPNQMIDVSKYIFDSLKQAIESADFSESLAYQTKTSAQINAKSLELKQLIGETQSKILSLQERFERGVEVSRNIRKNLDYAKKSIEKINGILRTEYPIEYNKTRENIMERNFNTEDNE